MNRRNNSLLGVKWNSWVEMLKKFFSMFNWLKVITPYPTWNILNFQYYWKIIILQQKSYIEHDYNDNVLNITNKIFHSIPIVKKWKYLCLFFIYYQILLLPRKSSSALEIFIKKSSRKIYFQDRYCKSEEPRRITESSNYLIINNALRAPLATTRILYYA